MGICSKLAWLPAGSLLALAIGCGRSDRSERPPIYCVANLKQIGGAIIAWSVDHGKSTNDIVTWNDLIGTNLYLPRKPECPYGGTYTITRVGELPTCSIPRDTAAFNNQWR